MPNTDCEMASKEKSFQNREQVLSPKQSDIPSNVHDKESTPLSLLFKYNSVSYQGNPYLKKYKKKRQFKAIIVELYFHHHFTNMTNEPVGACLVKTLKRGGMIKTKSRQKMDCLVSQLIFEPAGFPSPQALFELHSWWHITASLAVDKVLGVN